jgi:hypothetical protein
VFTAWDARDRPVSGVNTREGASTPIWVYYDDPRRVALWSNEEWFKQDANGNLIEESGPTGHITYTPLSTAEACK